MTDSTQSSLAGPTAADLLEATNAQIVHRENLTDYLSILRIQPDETPVPEFKPGQFATLGLPRLPTEAEAARLRQHGKEPRIRVTRRAYSIASAPSQREYLEFFIILVEDGKLTPEIWKLPDNGRIWMHADIRGEFTLDPVPAGKDLVTISTGTGLAPFVSMYKAYRETGRWRRFVCVNGVRHARDLGYQAELEQFARQDPNFIYIPLVSRATDEDPWTGLRGRVNVLFDGDTFAQHAGFELKSEDAQIMLCGNPAMIDGVQETLTARGFSTYGKDNPEGNIHFERYW